MALELKIGAFSPVAVPFNYEELKKQIAEKTQPYKGLIVTEDAIPAAKTDLANLRRLEKAIDDRRKDVKKEYNDPYMEFEKKIKDILSDIQEAEQNIDSQVKSFEKQYEDEKLAQIQKFFRLSFGDDLAEYVNFGKLYNPKWMNRGYKMADIEAEIAAAANKLRDNIAIVKGLKSPHETSLLSHLFFCLDMGEVMAQHNKLMELDERRKTQEQPKQEVVDSPKFAVDTPEPLQKIKMWVEVNDAQKVALGNFLRDNGIRYGSIKDKDK